MKQRKSLPISFPASIHNSKDFRHDLGYHGILFSNGGKLYSEPDDYEAYFQDSQLCNQIFHLNGFDRNRNPTIVALKIYAIDSMNSTNLMKQKNIITVNKLAQRIVEEPCFDAWIQNGNPRAVSFLIDLVSGMAKDKNLVIFSFASKYCFYHYHILYQDKVKGIGAYSIYDSLMEKYLQDYPYGPTSQTISGWKAQDSRGYLLYNEAIADMLARNGCGNRDGARRELDQLVWWEGRKKEKLNMYLDDMVKVFDKTRGSKPTPKDLDAWNKLKSKKPNPDGLCMDPADFNNVLALNLNKGRHRAIHILTAQQIWDSF